ncbi:MAG: PadR family transcriptional regulator [Microbacteriaceae bacterium]|nr:PadR family transcriptional regulator [Microbacteriaceae bacterium]
MLVRYGILAILNETPCYGTQLRSELRRRSAGLMDVNAGQIYSTLERLARDGLVSQFGEPENGRLLYQITDSGREVFHVWLDTVEEDQDPIETIQKVSMALSLPSVDGLQVARRYLNAYLERDDLEASEQEPQPLSTIVRLGYHSIINTELNWLRQVLQQAQRTPTAFPVDEERPRRGRPPKPKRPRRPRFDTESSPKR